MKNILKGIGVDTSLVLLFLAVEIGHYGNFGSAETLLMLVSMAMVLVLPYFLPSAAHLEPSFSVWLVFRGSVAVLGLFLGAFLPESMEFLPMNFLILVGICSCFFQFYGLMKLRLAD